MPAPSLSVSCQGSDNGFYVAMTIAFILFLVELGHNLLYKPGYFLSFYFYIDFISAISLLPGTSLLLFETEVNPMPPPKYFETELNPQSYAPLP